MTNTTPAAKASTVRPPLAKGDDGSANRYPSRLAGSGHPDFEFVQAADDDYDRCQAAGVHVCSPDDSCDGA